MNLRRTAEKMSCAGVMLAVAFAWVPVEARAQKKPATTSNQAAAPAKPAAPAAKTPPPQKKGGPGPGQPKGPTPPPLPNPAHPVVKNPPTPVLHPNKVDPREPIKYQSHPGEQATPVRGGGQKFYDPKTERTVRTNPRGDVTHIEGRRGLAGTIAVSRGPGGARLVETRSPGGRVVSYGPHTGFVERSVAGRDGYISRTHVVGGRSYAHVYREYRYHGIAYYHYVPGVYYGSRFYGWAVTPWGAPVGYAWGRITAPWFGFYAGYFSPYSTYASPDLWLTDYLLAENLRLAYESQQAGNGGQTPPPQSNGEPTASALSPEIKALIADEVRQQLAAESAAAAQPAFIGPQQFVPGGEQPPPALSQKFFVVSSSLDLTPVAGPACSLTPGDIIQRKGQTVTAEGGVEVEVVSSKAGDCAADSRAAVQLADLQEMHNQFREQLDSGLKMLAENQAKPLPNGPDAGARPVAEGTADPLADAALELAAQENDAAKLEAQVRAGGGSN